MANRNEPYIEVQHSDDRHGAQAVASTYDMDTGVLSLPEKLRIGQPGVDCGGGHDYTIRSYSDQVDQYDIWLEEQVKKGNKYVMEALDDIYNKAISSGIILTTRCVPSPYLTHAHVVKRFILKLAS